MMTFEGHLRKRKMPHDEAEEPAAAATKKSQGGDGESGKTDAQNIEER